MTPEKKPLTLEETVQAIKEEHEDFEDVKAVLAMSSEELDRKLEAQGFDVAKLEARAEAREAQVRRELDAAPRAIPWWRRLTNRIVAIWSALLLLLSAAATHAVDLWRMAEPVTSWAHAPAPELRDEAFQACGKMQWQSCLDKLDEAARADPEGDKNPEVQRTRAFAKKQLAQ